MILLVCFLNNKHIGTFINVLLLGFIDRCRRCRLHFTFSLSVFSHKRRIYFVQTCTHSLNCTVHLIYHPREKCSTYTHLYIYIIFFCILLIFSFSFIRWDHGEISMSVGTLNIERFTSPDVAEISSDGNSVNRWNELCNDEGQRHIHTQWR